jgi:hypothetical protein
MDRGQGRRPVRVPYMMGVGENMRDWSLFMIRLECKGERSGVPGTSHWISGSSRSKYKNGYSIPIGLFANGLPFLLNRLKVGRGAEVELRRSGLSRLS